MIDIRVLLADARVAIARLERANSVAGGQRMGSGEAIKALRLIPELVEQLGYNIPEENGI